MISQIWKKEMQGELYTWKSMLWLVIVSLLFSFTCYLLLTDKELSLLDQTELMLLLGKIIIGVALLIVAIDASSIITTEFEKETAESLFLAPISVKDFIIGKFLSALTLWGLIFVVSLPYIIVSSLGSHLALAFISYIAFLGTLGIIGLISLIFAISLLYRSAKNTLTTALIVLIVFATPAFFSSTLKSNSFAQLFSAINPVDNIFSSLDNILVDYQFSILQNWKFILPLFIFFLLMLGVLILSVKRFNKQGIIKND
jgi:ABC-type transport system involved in multi-copper enzyme maturation permease subunit